MKPSGPQHAPITRALPYHPTPEQLGHKAATRQHWMLMLAYSGLQPLAALTSEDRDEYRKRFGDDAREVWPHAKIQTYCDASTKAIKAGEALPDFANWETDNA